MSEILVRGVEVGATCDECKLCIEIEGEAFCVFGFEPITYYVKARKKSDYCPAINIQPHGRLIDADELEDESITYYALPACAQAMDLEAELVVRVDAIDAAPPSSRRLNERMFFYEMERRYSSIQLLP